MVVTINKTWRQDKLLPIDDLSGYTFTGESGAHNFVIAGKNADGAVTISGSITGTFLNQDNVTVPLTGSIVDGCAEVLLTEYCYNVPGRFILTIYADTTAIYCGVGTVLNTQSSTSAYPTAAIPDLNTLITQAQTLIDSIDVATASEAVEYLGIE